jgi:hypothetical protein
MKINILIFLIFFFVVSCENLPKNPERWMEVKKNACLPTAIAFKEGLRKYNIWSEVVVYRWYDSKSKTLKGHAITVYMYPKGKNQLWTYDYWGSYRVRAYKDDPVDIAQKASNARNENRQILSANFLN